MMTFRGGVSVQTNLGRSPFIPLVLAVLMLAFTHATLMAKPVSKATEFKLANGMQVVVVPDTRAPVVTHMVWYKVGAADEPPGVSGIAHFLEHLMFKSTDKIPMGEFSKIVSRLGGQDNAFTGHDATAYFQRVSKEERMMTGEFGHDYEHYLRRTGRLFPKLWSR